MVLRSEKQKNKMIGIISRELLLDAVEGRNSALPVIKKYFPNFDDVGIRVDMKKLEGIEVVRKELKKSLTIKPPYDEKVDALISVVKSCEVMKKADFAKLVRLGFELEGLRGN